MTDARLTTGREPPPQKGTTMAFDAYSEARRAIKGAIDITNHVGAVDLLYSSLGSDRLVPGVFFRGTELVHTPAIGQGGYVEPKDGHDGPMQVRPLNKDSLAAVVNAEHKFIKRVKDAKGEESPREVLFPPNLASYVIAAPHYAASVRRLKGVTHAPVVRADGSLVAVPGYDEATGLLYAPPAGFVMDEVPEVPTEGDVKAARDRLHELVAEFPFVSQDDEANWLGMMLTPLLRDLVPSDRKMFVINAHQAGSGKTLLAKLGQATHDAVFRSALPEDETEMRKWATGILSTTTAPIVIADNVSGTLRSGFLAGLLTSPMLSDRVLGASTNIDLVQDRMWVLTGNNVQIGADISRRIVTIAIDPGVERPEERTGFRIGDLESYARRNRAATLHALHVLIRHWVAAGRPVGPREQSDSFLPWEQAIAGILACAGVPGAFNSAQTRMKVRDVDREDFADFLEKVHASFGDAEFLLSDFADRCRQVAPLVGVYGGPDELFDGAARCFGPDDMPTTKLADQLLKGCLNTKSLGHYLSARVDAWHGGFKLTRSPKTRDGIKWRVSKAGMGE